MSRGGIGENCLHRCFPRRWSPNPTAQEAREQLSCRNVKLLIRLHLALFLFRQIPSGQKMVYSVSREIGFT